MVNKDLQVRLLLCRLNPIPRRSPNKQLLQTTAMHFLSPLTIIATLATSTTAQNVPIAPSMTLLYSMAADLGDRFSLGPVPTGQERFVIPIIGGTFKGPRLSGSQIYPFMNPRLTTPTQARFSISAQTGSW
jgi:hypothetical protein